MRKIFSFCLIAAIYAASASVVFAADLSDIGGHDNEIAIKYLEENGVISGYEDGTFKPDNTVNRAELLKILVGGSGENPSTETYKNCFPDVKEDWYAPFVCFAKEEGWVKGYEDGTFKPEKEITRAEAMKMLVNAMEFAVSEGEGAMWYEPIVAFVEEKGILEDMDRYHENKLIDRGEISENIYRAMIVRQFDLENFEGYFEPDFFEFMEDKNDDWVKSGFNQDDLSNASVGEDMNGPVLILNFKEESKEEFATLTENNIGNYLGIFLDGEFISNPKIMDKISGDYVYISGLYTEEVAQELADKINEYIGYSVDTE
ncbi:hypothetical protein GF354_03830 [Candidatus Peregrinibacteria bacterium]|nr:hypothetical protein [Candidatus Peregrinibacteria bacterium]